MFNVDWVEVQTPDGSILPDMNVAIFARVLGLWYLNACRIVYLIDERGPIETTASPTARSAITPKKAKSGSPSPGTTPTIPSVTNNSPTHDLITCSPGSTTPSPARSKSALLRMQWLR